MALNVTDYSVSKSGYARSRIGDSNLVVVSSASYNDKSIAPDSLVTAFGANLATSTASATDVDINKPGVQLPTTLGGTTVRVKGVLAPLLFVSPDQVNFIVPESIAPSANEDDLIPVEVTSGDGVLSSAKMIVAAVAPAVFTMDGTGRGNPAAYLVRVRDDRIQNESLIERDAATGRMVFKPIDFGAEGERIFLVMFLSGIRNASDPNQDGNMNETVHVKCNGFDLTPAFAGPQPDFKGLEQINVEIPRNFKGHQQLEIKITGGVASNATAISMIVPPLTEAHWKASGLEGQDVYAFAAAGELLVAGAAKGIFRQGDDGTYWLESPYSLPTNEQKRRALALLKAYDFQLIAGTDGSGLWYSDSSASAWTTNEINGPLYNERIFSLAQSQRMNFAGTAANGVFRQVRSGYSLWQSAGLKGQKITALAASGDRVFAGTEANGLMTTADDGDHWAKVGGGLPADGRILALAVKGQTIFAGMQPGLWRSKDNGTNWTKASLPENLAVNAVLADDSNLLVGTAGSGVLVSTDDGTTWKSINDGLTNTDVLSLINFGGRLYAGTKAGVFVTGFVRDSNQPPTADSQTVALDEDVSLSIKLAGSDPDGDLIKFKIISPPKHGSLNGDTPSLNYTPFPDYFGTDSFAFIASDGSAASAPATVTINVKPVEDPLKLFVDGDGSAIVGGLVVLKIYGSDADGDKVTVSAKSLPQGAVFDLERGQSRAVVKWVPMKTGTYTFSFTATEDNNISVTKEFKVTVTQPQQTDDWSQIPLFTDKLVNGILVRGSSIYLTLSGIGSGLSSALLRSNDDGRTWTKIGNGLPINVRNYIAVDGGSALFLECSEGLYRSSDNGTSWANISSGKGLPDDGKEMSIAAQGDKLLAWTRLRIFVSLNAGGTWTEVTDGLPKKPISSAALGGDILKAAVSGNVLLVSYRTGILPSDPITFRSTDNGTSWKSASNGLQGPFNIFRYIVEGDRLYSVNNTLLFLSEDHGENWNVIPKGREAFSFFSTTVVANDLIMALYRDNVIQLSQDRGATWRSLNSISDEKVAGIEIGNSSFFAITSSGKLFRHLR